MKNKIGNKSQLGICLHNTNVSYTKKSEVGSPLAPGDVPNAGPTDTYEEIC